MLSCFGAAFGRNDISVTPTEAAVVIDRTLATASHDLNATLWAAARYPKPPTVPEMVTELAEYESLTPKA